MQHSPRNPARHLAARMGHWSAGHRKTAIFGWLAFVIAAIVIGTAVGQKTIDQNNGNVGASHRADLILKQAGFTQSDPLTEIAVIQSKTLTLSDPAFRSTVGDVESVDVRELNVEQDDVGAVSTDRGERGRAVGRLADHLVARIFEHAPRARPETGVVIDDQDGPRHDGDSRGATRSTQYG